MNLVFCTAETVNWMSERISRARATEAKCGAAGWWLQMVAVHCCTITSLLDGQVRGFRLQLWREHLGGLDDVFNQPESPECMARVRHLAEENWRAYSGDEVP